MTNVLKIVIGAIFFATLLIAAVNIIFNTPDSTAVTGETFNSSTMYNATYLKNSGLVSGSEVVYNSSKTFVNTNYTMDYAAGTITTKWGQTPFGYNMTNYTTYSIDYRYGAVDSVTDTLRTSVTALIIIVVAILLFLSMAGYKVKL